MSTSKHIGKICTAGLVLALLLTLLFVNGAAPGGSTDTGGDTGDSQFTADDLDGDWDSSGATWIVLTGDGAGIEGNGAYFYDGSVHIAYPGRYVLSGSLADGSVVVEAGSGDKVWLLLDGASIHCGDCAAILVEQADKVFLTLAEGTENAISSGTVYSTGATDSGIDGAIYSRDDLTINGSGALTVTAGYQHGIVCNDDLAITGGTISITVPQDGVHANDSVRCIGMDLTIYAGDDGVTVSNDDGTGYFYLESGRIHIPACYEGIEAVDVTVAGGILDIVSTDDGINANGEDGNSVIRIIGGQVRIVNETGRDADGLDSNGSIYISGGSTFISVSSGSCAIDCGSENGGVCRIDGGSVIACGGSFMADGFDGTSTQGSILYGTSGNAGSVVALKDTTGNVLLTGEIPCPFTNLVLSAPGLEAGDSCTLSIDGEETVLTVGVSSAFGDFGTGGAFGGRMPDGAFGGQGSGNFPDGSTIEGQLPSDQAGGDIPSDVPPMPGGGWGLPGEDGTQSGLDSGQNPPDGTQPPGRGEFPDRMGGGDRRGGLTEPGQDQEQMDRATDSETSEISPETLLLLGTSALILSLGLLAAWRTKH